MLIVFIICFHAFSVFAGSIDCEPKASDPWTEIQKPFELKPEGVNITVGASIPDGTLLYQLQYVVVGVASATCTGTMTNPYVNYALRLAAGTAQVATYGGAKVYPSGVNGIGISINEVGNGKNYAMAPSILQVPGWKIRVA